MIDLADMSALVLSHQRKVLEAADVLSEARVHVLASAVEESSLTEADQASRRSDELMHEALHLTATAERLVAEARAILAECGPVTAEPWARNDRN